MIARLKNLLFYNRSAKQTIAKNIFWLSVSQVGSRFIRAGILIYAARILGAAEYGVFSYVLGLAGFFTIFADLGVSPLMTREVAGYPEKRAVYFSNAFWMKAALLFLTAGLIVFVAPKFSNLAAAALLIPFVAVLTIFDNFRDFVFAYFRGIEKMEIEGFLTVIMNAAIAAAGFAILYFSKTAGALLFSYIASVVVLSFAAFYFVKDDLKNVFKNFDQEIFKKFFHDSWPLAFAGLFGVFMLNIDMVMLGWWRSPAEIGYYAASQRVVQILYTLPSILASAAFPALSRFIGQNDIEKARNLNERTMAVLYFVAFPLAIGGIVLGTPIIMLLFGVEYLPGVLTFQIFCATLLINFPGAILGNLILAHNQQRVLFKYLALGAFTNVFFDVLFIPRYGIAGSAVATFISQAIYFIPVWRAMKRRSNFRTLPYLKKIIVGAVIMGIFSYWLNFLGVSVVPNIIFSGGVYLSVLLLLKENIVIETGELFGKLKGGQN